MFQSGALAMAEKEHDAISMRMAWSVTVQSLLGRRCLILEILSSLYSNLLSLFL
jgi:hypothetical protein